MLDRRYPASSLIRASPSPHTARPSSHEMPVDRRGDHRWGFPCSLCLPVHACRRHHPGRYDENYSLISSIAVSLPRQGSGSAPASLFSRLVRRSFTLQPACSPNRLYDPLHRRLQRPRYLSRCFGCYRVERTSSRAGMFPLKGTVFPRRTPCASLSLLLYQDVKRTFTSKLSIMLGVIGIGGVVTHSPLPHHRRCGTAYGGSEGYAGPSKSRGSPRESK